MKVKTPNNDNIEPYLSPNTVYNASKIDSQSFFIKTSIHASFCLFKACSHIGGQDWIIVPETQTPNRDYLRDFVKMNNIKTTLVSKALGKSQNWLTQMMNDKRRDMTDATLKSILVMLHIQWDSKEVLNVKAHDGCSAYTTVPSTYTTTAHKERLQRSFWRGMVK